MKYDQNILYTGMKLLKNEKKERVRERQLLMLSIDQSWLIITFIKSYVSLENCELSPLRMYQLSTKSGYVERTQKKFGN